ncbi:Micos complex subunit mic10-like protein [Thalictrum thalictroides]|uniref:Micos complex subunit mic10-like protein n=1 Tax=Thalictrum thalictroides TaxID=46969 RepID=A0A7J6WE73_THATH|nr:Micos complex subunit mic10-like protein [Thalictrum thalictroides]
MAEQNQNLSHVEYDLDAKWDECLDLTLRRSCYSSLAGAFTGLLLFRSPVTRWVSVAFGAGIGIGSAYTECSQKFGGSFTKWTPPSKVPLTPASQGEED